MVRGSGWSTSIRTETVSPTASAIRPAGGHRLVGGVGPDPGQLAQGVPARFVHFPYGGEPRLFEGAEPQSAGRDLLQPGERDRAQLAADQLLLERVEGVP